MRLLFFSPYYGTLGGVRLIIDALARGARAAGHEVAAVVDGDALGFSGPARAIRCYPFPPRPLDLRRLRRFARKFPLAMARMVTATRRLAPDVVSVHCARRYAPYAAALQRLTGVPQVLSLQEGAMPVGVPEHPVLFRMLVRAAAAVAACSAEAAAYAARVGGVHRSIVVPNGYDPTEFANHARFARPRPYVLGVGRLAPEKGFDVLVEAFARLERTDHDLLLAGDGSARPALEELACTRRVAERVRFLGTTDRPTTVALLRSAAVVACPFRVEGLPLVCVEALAAGSPVVASAINGIPEIVRDGETGLLVPPDDPAALAAALARVLHDPADALRLAARGQASVEHEYSWPMIVPRYLALCRAVAAGDPSGAPCSPCCLRSGPSAGIPAEANYTRSPGSKSFLYSWSAKRSVMPAT